MGGDSSFPSPASLVLLLVVLINSPSWLSSLPAVVDASASASASVSAGLSVGFYRDLCPKAEKVVRRTVAKAFKKEPGTPADIIRLFFHDCFVRGCDASVLLESTPGSTAERDSTPNSPSLDGFEVIADAKEILEKLCPRTVSCADILALAARDGSYLAGGPDYAVPTGRRDGVVSREDEVLPNVPHPDFTHSQLVENFTAKGFTAEEMVTLSGAHTIGTSHCSSFTDRLYRFHDGGENGYCTDPSMPAAYASWLREKCPPETAAHDDPTMVQLDGVTPFAMDNQYYRNLLVGEVAFGSDVALLASPDTAALVERYAREPPAYWAGRFAAAMVKLGKMGALTGGEGEIRLNCSRVN